MSSPAFRPDTARLYARQFVAGPRWSDIPGLTVQHHCSNRIHIQVDELLTVTRAGSDSCELLCLGAIIDPALPQADDHAVLARVAAGISTFEGLEEATTSLTGRWILFARIAGRTRLYPDAGGLKSVFYTRTEDGVWLASQPGLLELAADVRIDPALASHLDRAEWADSWPYNRTPYIGVKQLLPNHYLDLDEGEVHRFWPRRPIEPCGTRVAAEATAALIRGTIEAAVWRHGRAALALTAGYESRCLLACSGADRSRLSFFTIVDPSSPWYEQWTPRRLAWKFHLDYRQIWTRRGQSGAIDVVKQNTGRMWRDPNEHRASGFGRTGAPVLVLGNVSEVCRAEYYEDRPHPEEVTAELLAKTIGWGTDALAIEAFREWLASVPAGMNIKLLDLFYWECRVGNWCSLDYTAMDTFVEPLSGFNCRRFFELGLGVPVADRQLPCELYLQVCRLTTPAALDLSFNSNVMTDLRKTVSKHLPHGVRNAGRGILKWLSGASPRG